MSRFVAGFLVASLFWGGFIYAYAAGIIDINLDSTSTTDAGVDAGVVEADDGKGTAKKKRKWRKKKGRKYRGNAMTGDDLGGPGVRNLDPSQGGGEEQLLGHEIEKGFDEAFPKIRRCLMLMADDQAVTGKIVFGMRVSGDGRVTKVNLKGPSAITKSEAGGCMRQAARSIRYRSFNGPDMVVHYPLTLN